MKVVIFAGGKGTRISEESIYRPKPLIEIGGKPILWHIMKWFSSFGYNEFVVCCGYKGEMIKQYFLDYYSRNSNVEINLDTGATHLFPKDIEPWKVTLVNTGINTLTAGRLKQIRRYIDGDTFMMTYGDGVGDIDIRALLEQHHSSGKVATISLTKPEGRFGAVQINQSSQLVQYFKEKARKDQSWINIGFSVFSTKVFDYLGDGNTMLEDKPYELLSKNNQMDAYLHKGFWSPMDTMKDKEYLNDLWDKGMASWQPKK